MSEKTVAETQAAEAKKETDAVVAKIPNVVERFQAACKAVDEGALRKAHDALLELCAAHAALSAAVKSGHKPHAGHNSAFERARIALHDAQGGAAKAIDKFDAFKSLHLNARDLYLAAEADKAREIES